VAGKVTIGLASHWPCITDLVIYPPMGSWPKERTWAPWLHSCMAWLTFTQEDWCSSAGKVTAGMVKSNDSLPPGLWLSHLWADC